MSEQDQGFTVKDRRIFSEDGEPRQDEPETGAGRPAAEAAQEKPRPRAGESQAGPEAPRHQLPPVDFGGLILSLSHTAALHLGLIPDAHDGQAHFEPALARHAIDTIAMLKEKTQGNLTQDEERLITGALTELRLAYVQLTK